MSRERERTPRCLGCLHFTGFSPLTPSEEAWDPDQELLDHVFTCQAFPGGIPAEVLEHRRPHHGPLPGQEGGWRYEPREEATLTCAQAAREVGCSAATIGRYLRSGLLWGLKRGGRWFVCEGELRLLVRPGRRARKIPPGFFRPV